MRDPYFEMLVDEFAEYLLMMEEFNTLVFDNGNKDAAYSFLVYPKYFCLDLIAHVDSGDITHRAFVNNLIYWDLQDMSANEYSVFFEKRSIKEIDSLLFADHPITRFLVDYDVNHNSDYFYRYISYFCTIADIFSDQDVSFREPVNEFVKDFKASADSYWASKGSSWGTHGIASRPNVESEIKTMAGSAAPAVRSQGDVVRSNTGTAQAVQATPKPQTETYRQNAAGTIPKNDGQYKRRVTIPLLVGVASLIIGLAASSFWLFAIAIVAFIFLAFGLKANKQRCPNCRAWDSIVTIKSDQVDSKKVKVRRNLNSTYYRTSGNATFGSRQVFVNADEITYNEVYRCKNCGYEMKGTRRVIDDGIR